jgi:small subunit ribosomal protein S18
MEEKGRKYGKFSERNRCRFCRANLKEVNYKDIETLKKLCTAQGKLFGRKRSGNCAHHQRQLKRAVKRARFMALMPYTN